jgi:transposase-like protein
MFMNRLFVCEVIDLLTRLSIYFVHGKINKPEHAGVACKDCDLDCRSFGRHRNGLRRFRCPECGKTFTEPHSKPLGTMTVPMDKALMALQLLLEGNSIRSAERVTGIDQKTIMKLLVLAGEKCEKIMGRYIRNVAVKDVECDEVWSFLGKKKSAFAPKTTRTWATATPSSPSNETRNWCSISRWGSAIRLRPRRSLKAFVMRSNRAPRSK